MQESNNKDDILRAFVKERITFCETTLKAFGRAGQTGGQIPPEKIAEFHTAQGYYRQLDMYLDGNPNAITCPVDELLENTVDAVFQHNDKLLADSRAALKHCDPAQTLAFSSLEDIITQAEKDQEMLLEVKAALLSHFNLV